RVKHGSACALHRTVCRRVGDDFHQSGGADIRDEHEPRANSELRGSERDLDRDLDLLHRAPNRNAAGSGSLLALERRAPSVLRQAASSQPQEVHLSMQLRRVTKRDGQSAFSTKTTDSLKENSSCNEESFQWA